MSCLRRMYRNSAIRTSAVAVMIVLVGACEEPILVDRDLVVDATATVRGSAFLDFNGSGSQDEGDRPAGALQVNLVHFAAEAPPLRTALTDSTGTFVMADVPAGTYRLELEPASVGDSIEVVGFDENRFTLGSQDTMTVSFFVTYPTLTLMEARHSVRDRKIFTHGIALNPSQQFGAGAIHLQEDSAYLRATNVAQRSVLAGDSLRLLGTTGTEAGRPVLRNATAYVLKDRAVFPRPLTIPTAQAATAGNGGLDAALVRVESAEILDTATVENDFVATVDDGSGPVDIVLRDLLDFNTGALSPGSTIVRDAIGLLVAVQSPVGEVSWTVVPRFLSDLQVE